MKGDKLENIYIPIDSENWIIIKTDISYYELRLGGYEKTDIFIDEDYSLLKKNVTGTVEQIYTDSEWVYIKMSSGFIIHGPGSIDGNGNISFIIKTLTKTEFIENYGDNFFMDPYIKEIS